MPDWKAAVNGKEHSISMENGKFRLNDKPLDIDIAQIGMKEFSIIYNDKSYNAEAVEVNRAEKKFIIKVNGNEYEVLLKNKFHLLLLQMGMSQRASQSAGILKAPMPGKVLRVDVTLGQQVKKGDSILILEAMKMENAIKSPGDGSVKSVKVKPGDAVEKGEGMVEIG